MKRWQFVIEIDGLATVTHYVTFLWEENLPTKNVTASEKIMQWTLHLTQCMNVPAVRFTVTLMSQAIVALLSNYSYLMF